VLDYLITTHLYNEYPGMSPGQLTDMRSASVNNDCYAMSAIKVQLHKHVLHASQELHKHIAATLDKFDEQSSSQTFGWESEASFPKVSLSKSRNNAITVIVLFEQRKLVSVSMPCGFHVCVSV